MLAINRKVAFPGYVKGKSIAQENSTMGRGSQDKDLGEGETDGRH